MNKLLIIWFIVGHFLNLAFFQEQEVSEEYEARRRTCQDSCGGEKYFFSTQKNGSMICVETMKTHLPQTPCQIKCMDIEIPTDQPKCWCEVCKSGETSFCKKPYDIEITTEQCSSTICSKNQGGLKWFGPWCKTEGEHWGGPEDLDNAFQI